MDNNVVLVVPESKSNPVIPLTIFSVTLPPVPIAVVQLSGVPSGADPVGLLSLAKSPLISLL